MTPEDALLDYLYAKLVEALQRWKGFDDIYGIWLFVQLTDEIYSQTELANILALRECAASERERSYSSRWAPGFLGRADEEITFRPTLCSAPWPPSDPAYDHIRHEDIYNPSDPEGCRLRDRYFDWKRTLSCFPSPPPEYHELSCFLDICGVLIRLLHQNAFFEKPVPVGLFYNNDRTATLALPIVQAANPSGLADGMLAWMREHG